MKCSRASDLMSDHLDGELPVAVGQEFQLHLERCPECAKALDDMKQMLQCLSRLSDRRTGIDCWPGVRTAILAHEQRGGSWLAWVTRPVAWGSAFALTVLVGILALIPLGSQRDVAPQITQAEYKTYISAHSKLQRQHPLNDPDVAFITAEIENASYTTNTAGR
jgi:anti-sigma factor RsiW